MKPSEVSRGGEPNVSVLRKYLTLIPLMLYYMVGYFWTNAYNTDRTYYFDFSLPIDHHIPFHPAFILGYLIVFFLVIEAVFLIVTVEDLRRSLLAMFYTMTLGFLLFLLFPSTLIGRPVVDPTRSWADWLCGFFFYLDEPHDLFPSMHLGMSVVCALLVRSHHKTLGAQALAFASLVAMSVLLVHQHYVADVVSGALLGWGGYRAAHAQEIEPEALRAWWRGMFHPGTSARVARSGRAAGL